MNRFAWLTIVLALIAAVCDVGFAIATSAAWAPGGPTKAQLVFIAGPLLFLALMAWRRGQNAARSLLLFRLGLIVTVGGVLILGFDYFRFLFEQPDNHVSHSHPLIVPLVQWLVVMAVWIVLVIRESGVKQSDHKSS